MIVELTFKQLAFLFFKRVVLWNQTTNEDLLRLNEEFFDNILSIIKGELEEELGSDWVAKFFLGNVYSGATISTVWRVLNLLKNSKQDLVYGIDFTDSEFELFRDVLSIRYRMSYFTDGLRRLIVSVNELWDELEKEING